MSKGRQNRGLGDMAEANDGIPDGFFSAGRIFDGTGARHG
jgi:hypothetical protein